MPDFSLHMETRAEHDGPQRVLLNESLREGLGQDLLGADVPVELQACATFEGLVARILSTMEGLRTRSVVAQLPGRHLELIGAERAADILLDGAADKPEHDVWTLVEGASAQRAIAEHVLKKRRRRA